MLALDDEKVALENEWSSRHESAIATHSTLCASLCDEHAAALSEAKASYASEVLMLEEAADEIRAEHTEAIAELKTESADAVRSAEEAHADAVDGAETAAAQLRQLRAAHDTLLVEHAAQKGMLSEVVASHDSTVSKLSSAVSDLRAQLNASEEESSVMVSDLRAELAQSQSELREAESNAAASAQSHDRELPALML